MNKLILAPVLFLFAFASSAVFGADQAASNAKKYASVYVSKVILQTEMDRSNAEEVKYYADLEAESTATVKRYFTERGYTVAEAADVSDSKQLTINTKAMFNAGNQAVRWVGGLFGAGKASAIVTVEAIESPSGKPVSSKKTEDTMRMGRLGGSAQKFLLSTIESACDDVINDIEEGS